MPEYTLCFEHGLWMYINNNPFSCNSGEVVVMMGVLGCAGVFQSHNTIILIGTQLWFFFALKLKKSSYIWWLNTPPKNFLSNFEYCNTGELCVSLESTGLNIIYLDKTIVVCIHRHSIMYKHDKICWNLTWIIILNIPI